ncbi:MAG: hypothetical protein M3441_04510 [Chloroflexota bacterium]|nr:hypothetical protein [Chloroflexota bacterium]
MSARVISSDATTSGATMSFQSLGGTCAILAGAAIFLYSVAFVLLKEPTLYSSLQLVGSLAATVALVALYERLRATGAGVSLWFVLMGSVAALGSATHGAYDLANTLNPPRTDVLADANLPNLVDPRGFLTFGLAGLALLAGSRLISRTAGLPPALAYVGYALAALMIITWLARLIVLDASSPLVLLPAALTGFVANPVWYALLGLVLLRQRVEPVVANPT